MGERRHVAPRTSRAWVMRRVLVLAACLALSVGCKKKRTEYDYWLSDGGDRLIKVVSIERDGVPLPKADDRHWLVKVPAAERLEPQIKHYTLVVETTCGQEKLPATALTTNEEYDREPVDRGTSNQVLVQLMAVWPKRAQPLVDRDGLAPTSTVKVGVTPLQETGTVVVGSCATATDVVVDGVTVGKVTAAAIADDAKGAAALAPTTVVDAKGGHCYELVLHGYVDKDTATTGSAPVVTPLTGARTYAEHVDDFLKPSPKEVQTDELLPTRRELRRCGSNAAPPSSAARTPGTKKKHR